MQNDLAIVRNLVNSWMRGNILAVRAALDHRVVARMTGAAPKCHKGIDSAVAILEEWRTSLDAFSADAVDVVPSGHTFVAHCRFRRRCGNGTEQEIDETQTYRLLNGRVVSIEAYRAVAGPNPSRQHAVASSIAHAGS